LELPQVRQKYVNALQEGDTRQDFLWSSWARVALLSEFSCPDMLWVIGETSCVRDFDFDNSTCMGVWCMLVLKAKTCLFPDKPWFELWRRNVW
jgi:hypothetical protein